MILHGTRPAKLDTRDLSFHRTFPLAGAIAPALLPLMEYNYDLGRRMQNQNELGMPYGCTGMTQPEICSNQDGVLYKERYTYEKTCLMENHPDDQGCDIRTSFKSLMVYGLQAEDETTDQQAMQHIRGPYFNVDKAPGRDWFDSFRIALRAGAATKTCISLGIPWMTEFGAVGSDGILTSHFVYDGVPEHYSWHDSMISGEHTINGVPYLIDKSWQGKNVGDKGWVYFDRETFNKVFDNWGTLGMWPSKETPDNVVKIKVEIYRQVLDFLYRLLKLELLQQLA